MTESFPGGVPNREYFWAKDGISLAEFDARVQAAIAQIQAFGGVTGITPYGADLLTSLDAATARAKLGVSAGSGGTTGGAIGLPIAISDVTGLQAAINARALLAHQHASTDITGLTTDVRSILNAANYAAIRTLLGPTFPPSAHTHPISDVTGLQAQLDAARTVTVTANTSDVTVTVAFVLTTTNTSAVRPAIPVYATGLWNVPGSVPPVNMTNTDLWLA